MLLKCPIHTPFGVAFCHIVALVVELFTLCQGKRHLDKRAFQLDGGWNQRIALLLNLSDQLSDFLFMQ